MLYICPTPIGNLNDITLRTLEVLKTADIICCEDTRHSLKLLNHFEIKAKLISVHEHNENSKAEYILDMLRDGKKIALISDAGMPGISDPGAIVIKAAKENNLEYTVLPGPSAVIVAAVGSTLATDGFTFVGFLPRKTKDRITELEKYKHFNKAIVFYESPHRIKDMVEDLAKVFDGDRKVALIREISKKFEEYFVSTVDELRLKVGRDEIKGELIVVVEGMEFNEEPSGAKITVEEFYKACLKENIQKKSIAKLASQLYDITKNKAYEQLLDM